LKKEGVEQTGEGEGGAGRREARRGMTSYNPIAEVTVFMEMTKSKIV